MPISDSLTARSAAFETDMSFHLTLDNPSAWVRRFAPHIPVGRVLDLACGTGRHAKLLASLGHEVTAVDRDAQALAAAAAAAPGIHTLRIDLENGFNADMASLFAAGSFAGIVVTNYLHRPLWPHLLCGLAPGGMLIYETFAKGNERFGKPSNPDFLLGPGELIEAVRRFEEPLHVLAFEDGYVAEPKPAMVQRICAVRPFPGMMLDTFPLA